MYKMAVLDIDGTLADPRGNISTGNRAAINKAVSMGAVVTVCTGRNMRKAMPVMKKAGIKAPFVCIDGVVLYDPVKGCVLKDYRLDAEEVEGLLSCEGMKDAYIELSDGFIYHKYIKNRDMLAYDPFNRHDFAGRIKSYFGGARYYKSLAFAEKFEGPVYQMVVGARPEILSNIKHEIGKKGLKGVDIRDTIMKDFLFLNRKGIHKAAGIRLLCDYYQIDPKEVIAVGDEENDVEMIQMAGLGVAMGNAVDNVKKVADEVTLDNGNDGVARVLEKYFL